jgi:hypothetical protein
LLITQKTTGMSCCTAARDLLEGHLEAAVAVDRDDRDVRSDPDLRADGGGHGEAHGPEPAGVDPLPAPRV